MRRVVKALISNGLFSCMTLLLSVVIARSGGTKDLGVFGVSFAAYLLVLLIVRDAGANTLSAALPSARRIRAVAGRVSFMGVAFAIPMVGAGFVLAMPHLVIVGFAIHGLCLYDYSKTLSLSLGDGRTAIAQDVILVCFFSVGAFLTISDVTGSVVMLSFWAFGGAVIGYIASYLQVFRMRPRWAGDASELRVSIGFGLQALVGSGSVHILTFLLAAVTGPLVVGSIRGASTILGPANLITTSLQPLMITHFARTAPRPGAVSMTVVYKSASGLVLSQVIAAATLGIIGYSFGEVILGQAWADSAPLLAIVALDSVVVALGSAALAAHRSLWASRRLASLNICTAVTRIPLVLVAALAWGAEGAVLGLLSVSVASAFAAWISLIQLGRAHR